MEKEIIFCFDSTAFIEIGRYLAKLVPQLYPALDLLFQNGKIISHEIVYRELTTSSKHPDFLSKWISSKKAYFRGITQFQTLQVADIVAKFPAIINYKSEKDQADPWLIALIIEERLKNSQNMFSANQDIVMVSEESIYKASKIPDVCRYYKIQHHDLLSFFKLNGWHFSMAKS